MITDKLREVRTTALQFAQALARRDYSAAHLLTSHAYQQQISIPKIQEMYEQIIPDDWGLVEIVTVDELLEDWPNKQPADIGFIYISLEGQHYPYSEGLFICVSRENGHLVISDVTYGR